MPSFALFFHKDLFYFGLFFSQKRLGIQWKLNPQSSPIENQDIFFLEYNFNGSYHAEFYTTPYFVSQATSPTAHKNVSSNQGLLHGHTSHRAFLVLNIRLGQPTADTKQFHNLNFPTILNLSSTR